METVVFALYFAGRMMLQAVLIALMAIPVGFGLSIGYMLGKGTYGWLGAKRRIRAMAAEELRNSGIGEPVPEGTPA